MEIIFKGRQTDVPSRFRDLATAKLSKLEKLDQKSGHCHRSLTGLPGP